MANNGIRLWLRSIVVLLGMSAAGATTVVGFMPVVRPASRMLRSRDQAPEVLVEHTVLLICAGVLAVVLLWLAASVTVCLADAMGARTARGSRPESATGAVVASRAGLFRPRLARALVAIALGSAATVAAPVAAGPRADHDDRAVGGRGLPATLAGLPLPERPYGGVRIHEVRSGESLWSITESHLSGAAGPAEVARWWPALHLLNRNRIGADPHLIRPGTILRLPVRGTAPTRGAPR